MTAIAIEELADPDPGPHYQEDGNIDLYRTFAVLDSSSSTSGATISQYAGLPRYYFPHPSVIIARAVSLEMKKSPELETYWELRYHYSTKLNQSGYSQPDIGQFTTTQPGDPLTGEGHNLGDRANANPLLRPPVFKFNSRRYTEHIYRDVNGNIMQNSANDPYEPVARERSYLVLHVTKCLPPALFNPLVIGEYVQATNSVPYLGWAPFEVLLDDMDAEPKYENGITYWEVSAQFVFNKIRVFEGANSGDETYAEGGWLTRRLDAGYRELVGTSHVRIVENGQIPTRPILLNGAGRKLTPTTATPKYKRFRTYIEKDFKDLNLF